MTNKAYTVKEVAEALAFSTNTIYKYLDEGKIKATRLGKEGRFRIPKSEVVRLLGMKGNETLEPTVPLVPEGDIEKLNHAKHIILPPLFDWFVALLGIFLGISHFLFPLSLQQPLLQSYSSSLFLIQVGLFVFGIALIGKDISSDSHTRWHIFLHAALGILFLALAFIFLQVGIFISMVAYLVIGLMLFVTLYFHLKDIVQFMLLSLLLATAAGILFLYQPTSFPNPEIAQWISSHRLFFGFLWFGASIITLLGAIFGYLKNNLFLLMMSSYLIAAGAFIYGFFAFSQGLWEGTLSSTILGSFALLLPFWRRFKTFSHTSRKAIIEGFSWFVGLILIGGAIVFFSQSSFKTYVLNEGQKTAFAAAKLIENFVLERAKYNVANFATNERLIPLMVKPKKDLEALGEMAKEFYLSSTTLRRVIIYDSSGTRLALYPYQKDVIGLNVGDHPSFQQAKETKQLVISDGFQPRVPGTSPAVLVIAPLLDEKGEFLGTVHGSVDFVRLEKQLQSIQFGFQGDFIIADGKKKFIFHRDKNWLLKSVEPKTALANAVEGKSGVREEYDEKGELRLQAFAPIKSLGWGVVASQPLAKVLGHNSGIIFIVFLTTIVSGAGSLLIILYLRKI